MSINSLTDYNNGVRSAHARTSPPDSRSPAKTGDGAASQNTSTEASYILDLSPLARAAANAAAQLNEPTPAQDFSVGSGYNSDGKAFDQVKQDMRALFDARTQETGIEISTSTKGEVIGDFLGDIKDRRALFAIYGDDTGTFTKAERYAAYGIMWQQKNDAEYGPLRIKTPGDYLGHHKRGIDFLEQASPEEKSTFDWVEQRAVAQINYEKTRISRNYPTDPSDSYGRVNTGDVKVDNLIQMLVREGVQSYYRPIDEAVALEHSDAYAQAQRDFNALLDAEYAFAFTPTSVEA